MGTFCFKYVALFTKARGIPSISPSQKWIAIRFVTGPRRGALSRGRTVMSSIGGRTGWKGVTRGFAAWYLSVPRVVVLKVGLGDGALNMDVSTTWRMP